ncbi:hypothetical protein B0G80_2850 [Paraburkholderia sp. BL6669N2]|uniref:hypothetical protein n=1 Tax=Paraburkholderia sp. BL6669N2 TaxID=1938807 RepID=UPI000E255C1D|nr:hypothetical protein [Paraburkholderia sp. BL6669N2]REG60067.1 hypothetical protein B0G80_2850 [Paraburkholderia sp. BL6669N2]
MKKEDFRQAIRTKLGQVPLETRKGWNGTDLLLWWLAAKDENSYLTLDHSSGDLWQRVHSLCIDLIGNAAVW